MPTPLTDPTPTSPIRPADGGPRWLKYVAMLTGVLAGLSGYLTLRGTSLSNEAIYHSSQGVLLQARASDAWAEYQADSIKARIVETQLAAGGALPEARPALEAESKKLRDRQPGLKSKAEQMEKQRDEKLEAGGKRLAERDDLGYAGMAAQLAIALASVAALMRRPSVFGLAVVIGLVALGITGYVLAVHHLVKA